MSADPPIVRNARAEARAVLGEGFEARVLEPSPPAVDDGEWYADDPTARGDAAPGVTLVSPVPSGDVTWDELATRRPELAPFAAARWLGAWPRLPEVPPRLVETRRALNLLTFYVLSQVRKAANGKIAVRSTYRGFGTPFFGGDTQVRVEGTDIVVQQGTEVRTEPISTLRRAAEFVGVPLDLDAGVDFDVPDVDDPDDELAVDPAAAAFLADWFGFGTSVLEELRCSGRAEDDVSRVQLWAEHFDAAVELGRAEAGQRGSYGASPGDAAHPEPYLYVAPWSSDGVDEKFFADPAFGGANLPYRDLLAADDQRGAALAFLQRGLGLLTGRALTGRARADPGIR